MPKIVQTPRRKCKVNTEALLAIPEGHTEVFHLDTAREGHAARGAVYYVNRTYRRDLYYRSEYHRKDNGDYQVTFYVTNPSQI